MERTDWVVEGCLSDYSELYWSCISSGIVLNRFLSGNALDSVLYVII